MAQIKVNVATGTTGTLATANIADDAITAAKIADNAVVTAAINADAVTDAKIADDVIGTEHLTAGEVDTTALGADSVTAAKIGDNVLDSEHYAAASIDNEHLADDAVGIAELSATGTASSSTFLRGDNSWTAVTGTTINNNANNRVVTGSGTANTLEGEANLTYDGTTLSNIPSGTNSNLRLQNSTTGSGSTDGLLIQATGNDVYINNYENADLFFRTNNTDRLKIENDGKVGIGETAPLGKLHVKTADANGATVHADTDELVIEGSGNSGMTILSGQSGEGAIAWGDADNDHIAKIIFDHASDLNAMKFVSNASERMRIDSAGKVQIGTTTTSGTASGLNDLIVGNSSSGPHGISILTSATQESYLAFADGTTSPNPAFITYNHTHDRYRIWGAGAEKMRINSNGRVQIGTDASNKFRFDENSAAHINYHDADNGVVACTINGHNGASVLNLYHDDTSGIVTAVTFLDGDNQTCGSIGLQASNNNAIYNTSSDYRMKENEVLISDGITRVKQIKPYRFNWKTNPGTRYDGFFAHEIQEVVLGCGTGTKDETETLKNCILKADGTVLRNDILEEDWQIKKDSGHARYANTTWVAEKTDVMKPQGVDYGMITPLLTAALQEAITKIETLEAKVTALENA